MRPELEQLARIDSYVNNTMSADDAAAFETEMQNDPAIKEAVETQSLMITAVNRKALMAHVIAAAPTPVVQPRDGSFLSQFKWPIILSSIVVAAVVSWFVFSSDKKEVVKDHNELHSNEKSTLTPQQDKPSTPIIAIDEQQDIDGTYEPSSISKRSTVPTQRYGGLETWVQPDIQKFNIDPVQNELIECGDGTVIFIPKNAFADANGTPVREAVTLEVIEALTMDKIAAYNLATMNGSNALKSGGMIYIQPKLNGEKLSLADGKALHIEVPTGVYDSEMMAWRGVPDGKGNINWESPQEIENYLIPVAMSSLDFLPDGFREEVAATLPFKNHTSSTTVLEDSLYYALASEYEEGTNTSNEAVESTLTDSDVANTPLNKVNATSEDQKQRFRLPIKINLEKRKKSKIRTGMGAIQFMNLPWNRAYKATFTLNGESYSTHVTSDTIQTDLIGLVDVTLSTAGCESFTLKQVEISADVITLLNCKEWLCPNDATTQLTENCEKCYLDPSSIFAIQQPEFEETFLATREFQERLQALHRIKNAQPLFELYVNQLDKNLHEIDSEVAQQLSGNDKAIFEVFASQKLTNVKPNGQEFDHLRNFYNKQLQDQRKKVRQSQKRYDQQAEEELRAAEQELVELQSNYYKNRRAIEAKYQPTQNDKVGEKRSFKSSFAANRTLKTPANFQNSNPQVGQQPAYKVNWYGTGWMNIDAFLHELSKGKKQIPIHVAKADNMKVYQSVNSLNTLLTLNNTADGYTAHFPTSQSTLFEKSLALGVRKTNGQLEVAAAFFNPYASSEVALKTWEKVSEEEFKRRLKELYPGGKQLIKAMNQEQKQIREALDRKRRAEEMRKKRESEMNALQEEFKQNNAQLEAKTEAIRMRQAAERLYIQHLENFINPCHNNFRAPANTVGSSTMAGEIVSFPDVDAKYPGGSVEFISWISNNLKYPEEAIDSGLQGKVYLEFVVEKNGAVSNVTVKNSDPKMKLLEKEAVRLVQGTQPWISGEVDGEKVRSYCRVPITFTLD